MWEIDSCALTDRYKHLNSYVIQCKNRGLIEIKVTQNKTFNWTFNIGFKILTTLYVFSTGNREHTHGTEVDQALQ